MRVYINGVSDQFRRKMFDLSFFNHRYVREVLAGIRRDVRGFHDEASEKRRLPFAIGMFLFMLRHVLGRHFAENRAFIACFCLGFSLLCRASELLPMADEHSFRGKDIRFHRSRDSRSSVVGVGVLSLKSKRA